MLEGDFGEKCIIIHFLGWEKDRKREEKASTQRRREKI
jgi:hypothetical protein